jgi:hypothetical protein
MRAVTLLLLLLSGGLAAAPAASRSVVSVVAPLAYGRQCWSTVELRNLGVKAVAVTVEGHKESGALVGLEGVESTVVKLAPRQRLSLKLRDAEGEAAMGWVRVLEDLTVGSDRPVVAVSGKTECLTGDQLRTMAQTVSYPMRNPEVESLVEEMPGRLLLLLNTSGEAAEFDLCYSRGSWTVVDDQRRVICSATSYEQLPPFGLATVPISREGSTEILVKGTGAELVIRALRVEAATTRLYSVDSSIRFVERR